MKISGFSMVKNATKLYYPVKQSIMSILPIVDEFVVALGDNDADDNTEEIIKSINSEKIKIIHTKWDINNYPNGTENAHQTDIARENCIGDWLFYLQADEVIHERYLDIIKNRCKELLNDQMVEGFLFKYIHFWGDYNHHQISHGWYKNEIRIIRNNKDIHSWESAQSFRRIPGFDGKNYRQQKETFKLKVASVPAYVYHYGWVRPPQYMQSKKKSLDTIHKGKNRVNRIYKDRPVRFDYGPLGRIAEFKDSHPSVMNKWITEFNWQDELNYSKEELNPSREKSKHDKLKYKLLTIIEQNLFKGKEIGGFNNYLLLKDK